MVTLFFVILHILLENFLYTDTAGYLMKWLVYVYDNIKKNLEGEHMSKKVPFNHNSYNDFTH